MIGAMKRYLRRTIRANRLRGAAGLLLAAGVLLGSVPVPGRDACIQDAFAAEAAAGSIEAISELTEAAAETIETASEAAGSVGSVTEAETSEPSSTITVTLEKGEYTFYSSLENNMVVDVPGGHYDVGAQLQIYRGLGGAPQRFTVSEVGGGWYHIACSGGQVLAVADKNELQETGVSPVVLAEEGYENTQLWTFEWAGDGYVYLTNKLGARLHIAGDEAVNKATLEAVTLTAPEAADAAADETAITRAARDGACRWRVANTEQEGAVIKEGRYILRTAVSETRVLDLSGGRSANGTNIQIWGRNGANAQIFTIEAVGDGWYHILTCHGKALDVSGSSTENNANVQQWGRNGANAQLWRFHLADDGSYYIESKLGNYLDVAGGEDVSGTNVRVHEKNNAVAERWFLIRLEDEGGTYRFGSALNTEMVLTAGGEDAESADEPAEAVTKSAAETAEEAAEAVTSAALSLSRADTEKAAGQIYTAEPVDEEIASAGWFVIRSSSGLVLQAVGMTPEAAMTEAAEEAAEAAQTEAAEEASEETQAEASDEEAGWISALERDGVTGVELAEETDADAQLWRFKWASNDYVYVQCKAGGDLWVTGNEAGEGAQIQVVLDGLLSRSSDDEAETEPAYGAEPVKEACLWQLISVE